MREKKIMKPPTLTQLARILELYKGGNVTLKEMVEILKADKKFRDYLIKKYKKENI